MKYKGDKRLDIFNAIEFYDYETDVFDKSVFKIGDQLILKKFYFEGYCRKQGGNEQLVVENLYFGDNNFKNVKFFNVLFKNCNFRNTKFSGCEFHNVTFENCSILFSVFSGVNHRLTNNNFLYDNPKNIIDYIVIKNTRVESTAFEMSFIKFEAYSSLFYKSSSKYSSIKYSFYDSSTFVDNYDLNSTIKFVFNDPKSRFHSKNVFDKCSVNITIDSEQYKPNYSYPSKLVFDKSVIVLYCKDKFIKKLPEISLTNSVLEPNHRTYHSNPINNLDKELCVGPIGSRNDYTVYNVTKDMVTCGCWNAVDNDGKKNTLDLFKKRVEEEYGNDKNNKEYYEQYMSVIEYFKRERERYLNSTKLR